MIDDDICNRKIEFIEKSEIMKKNRSYKKVDKKIWRFLKCEEILVAPRDFLTNFDLENSAIESLFSRIIRIEKIFFDQLEPTFLANFYA